MSKVEDALAATMPRILTFDIETSPNIAHVWGLFQQNVAPSQLVEPSRVLCWAAKWYDQRATIFRSEHHDGHETMIRDAYDLLSEADILVHYNGDAFDLKHLRREFLLAGLPPLNPSRSVDLLKVARRRFKFASNKLDHVSRALGIGRKVSHPGHELWVRCLAGDEKAWALMKRYNANDVRLTEDLYTRLRPWIDNHPHVGLWSGEPRACYVCGSTELERTGSNRTALTTYARYRCAKCGAVSRNNFVKSRVEMRPAR